MTTAIILIVILLTLAYFYLKCPVMGSFLTLIATLFATVITLSYYETIAEFFISGGYGGDWALSGCYVVVFVLGLAIFRTLADLLVGSNIDLGKPAKVVASLVCGLITGVLLSGNFLIAMGLMPVQNKVAYTRFPPADNPIVLSSPVVPILNVDGFVAGLYGWLSRGALASNKSFSVVRADFLTQCHLNRYRVNDGAQMIASRKSLVLPPKAQKPLRLWTVPDKGSLAVLRVGISTKSIVDGGAGNPVKFSMAQLRLICKPADQADTLRGKGVAVWPEGLLKNGTFVAKRLDDMVDEKETLGTKDRVLWIDAAFKVPDGQVPVAFQFKQNVMADLVGMAPTPTSAEIEQGLNADEKKPETPATP